MEEKQLFNKVYQTNFESGKGNALQACIATLFNLKLDDTPNFINFPNYVEELSKFLKPYNMTFIKYSTINGKLEFEVFNSPYVLAAGKSPRGDYRHVVVGKINQVDFELVHDPYPDGSGLEGKPLWIGLFISINPNSNLIKS